jgi:hypothetical protein
MQAHCSCVSDIECELSIGKEINFKLNKSRSIKRFLWFTLFKNWNRL